MTKRNAAEVESQARRRSPADPSQPAAGPARTAHSLASDFHRYGEDLESRYVAARDAWIQAMRAAGSGRPADMASLALAQETYETVAAEREHWLATGPIGIPIEPQPKRETIEVAVGQELEWRRVLEHQSRPGLFARIRRRLGGH